MRVLFLLCAIFCCNNLLADSSANEAQPDFLSGRFVYTGRPANMLLRQTVKASDEDFSGWQSRGYICDVNHTGWICEKTTSVKTLPQPIQRQLDALVLAESVEFLKPQSEMWLSSSTEFFQEWHVPQAIRINTTVYSNYKMDIWKDRDGSKSTFIKVGPQSYENENSNWSFGFDPIDGLSKLVSFRVGTAPDGVSEVYDITLVLKPLP